VPKDACYVGCYSDHDAWVMNYRLLRLPTTIGLMALTLLASVLVVVVGQFVPQVEQQAELRGGSGRLRTCSVRGRHPRVSRTRPGSFFQPHFFWNSSGLSVSWPRSVCTT
jgi:hypothetical protein